MVKERPADFCNKVYTHQERQCHCGTEGYGSTLKNELFEAIEVRIRRWTSQLIVVVALNSHSIQTRATGGHQIFDPPPFLL